ncbi:MAG: HAD family hydrolase [Planctomycetota bacterium]
MLRAVLFDMDGTLTEPMLDFEAIRLEAGVPAGKPILEHLETVGSAERRRIEEILERHEEEAARRSVLTDGATAILAMLKERGIRTGVITRNSRRSVDTMCATHGLAFDVIMTREDGPVKPSAEPVLRACEALGVDPGETLMVGDYLFDVEAGRAAGARTAFYERSYCLREDFPVDYRLRKLSDLERILRERDQPRRLTCTKQRHKGGEDAGEINEGE